jgi:predicted 3-demethylubiquinone-9 3-methyltransferase (glyoxalase superfamily)
MTVMTEYPRITPFLWCDKNIEEQVDFYLSVFPNSRRLEVYRSSIDTPSAKAGEILTISFELDGQKFTALNGGPMFKFNEAISLVVRCDSQEEIDSYWSKLMAPGKDGQCGWLKDKYGLSWQVVPAQMPELCKNPKAMAAVMRMEKLDLGELERAVQASE